MVRTTKYFMIPLSVKELEMLLKNQNDFETTMKVRIGKNYFNETIKSIIKKRINFLQTQKADKVSLFTYWMIVNIEDKKVIGCVKFNPVLPQEETGEIFYFIDVNEDNSKNFLEALTKYAEWIFKNEECKKIRVSKVIRLADGRVAIPQNEKEFILDRSLIHKIIG